MDLSNILSRDESVTNSSTDSVPLVTPQQRPDIKRKLSSIHDFVNSNDHDTSVISSSNMSSPSDIKHLHNDSSILQQTPGGGSAHLGTIRARNSISSLTNDTDIDYNGNETPSIARRLSYETSESNSNSPTIPKKEVEVRKPSLQDVIKVEESIQVQEPVYDTEEEDDDSRKVKKQKIETFENKSKINEANSLISEPETGDLKKEQKEVKEVSKSDTLIQEKKVLKPVNPNKPKRYDTPPIWATKWVSKAKLARRGLVANATSAGQDGSPSDQTISSTGRLYSITGIRPYNDVTRRITGWIYAQLASISKENRKYIELEVKFGRVWDKRSDRRINLPIVNECILDDNYAINSNFKAGLDRPNYDRLKKYLTNMIKLDKEKRFRSLKFDHIDRQFREVSSGQVPKYYRITTDKQTGRVVANIEKKRVASLFIHSPDLLFDYRLSLSLELPSSENPERFENSTPELERIKKRTSIIHDLTATRFDITEVSQKSRSSKDFESNESLEFELEIDMGKLLRAYDDLENDNISFEEIGEIFMDNARILNRELIKPVK
ncbi:hypothetical protein WICMUC_003871 [Wickerhamomyces mucosus]|uniref:mRNA-capping enzyme subunit beta n=1 Tax=Wickerhamomyces mucosus TaxID=1378264 RepID=A0A9P8PJ57_9ASCO|nr:hypothetical protein WICMUC_003871 [Wickerhamomyces mucosus]